MMTGHMLYVASRVLTSSAAFVLVMAAFGLVSAAHAVAVLIAATLTGLAFATPAAAWAVGVRVQRQTSTAYRMLIMPLYMFSGTFFALSHLPGPIRVLVEALPLAQGVTLCRSLALGTGGTSATAAHAAYLCALYRHRLHRRPHHLPPQAARMTVRRALALVERNMMMYRRSVIPLAYGLVEPVMYLLTIGFGVGSLVGKVPRVNVRYPVFVAPAILATTAMNTAFNQTSFDVFSRIKEDSAYEAIVPTPLSVTDIAVGEVASAVLNGLLTSIGFLVAAAAMGLVISPGIMLTIPAAALAGFAFAAGGLAVTTFLRDFSGFQLVQLVMLPMYLFATTFYPLTTYPGWLRPLIEALPLYQSIELIRGPSLGSFNVPALTFAICYLALFGAASMIIATRRLRKLLLK